MTHQPHNRTKGARNLEAQTSQLQEIAELAQSMIDQHLNDGSHGNKASLRAKLGIGQSKNQSEWCFAFDRAIRRAGACDYNNKKITISKHFALRATEQELRQVLLHEIAHALAGSASGHGAKWRAQAKEIGYTGGRTISADFVPRDFLWLGVCPQGHKTGRYRKPSGVSSCGVCSPRFSRAHMISWQKRDTTR